MIRKNALICLHIISLFFIISASASQGVLIIGDSHSYGSYGEVLDSYYRKQGAEVSSYASCGSSPSNWVSDNQNFKATNCGYWSKDSVGRETRVKSHKIPSLTELTIKFKPKITVISLGTNILTSPENIKREIKFAEQMILKIKQTGSDCIWVGPPDLNKNPFKANLTLGVAAIKSTVEKHHCLFVDSRSYTKYSAGKGDGIHYNTKDSKDWGAAIATKLPKITTTSTSGISDFEQNKKTNGTQ